jgi:triacylglycerol lipase
MNPSLKRDPAAVLPQITLDAIAPPYLEYLYFQDSAAYPFRAAATGFDMVNAWWLIEAATLAWTEAAFAQEIFYRAGLPEMAFFNGPGTQCYVAGNDAAIVVAFRGSEIRPRAGTLDFRNILADFLADVDIQPVESGGVGKVHRGFQQGLDEVWEWVYDYLCLQRRGNNRSLWFTGHSLGAALATLAAQRYGPDCSLYTFGSPRVGDRECKDAFAVKAFRFVNHLDVVTRVPIGPYEHVGELYYIDGRGRIHSTPGAWDAPAPAGEGVTDLLDSLAWMAPDTPGFIPQGILDHVPLLYATHIWNNIP